MESIKLYCDGGCRGNQYTENIGGWGVYLEYKNNSKELRGGERNTTNNRMEMLSCIKGLEAIRKKDIPVEVVMDSQYVVSAFNDKWIEGWIQRGWRNAKKKPVPNQDLWLKLIRLVNGFSNIKFTKCVGHSGHFGNDKADTLANIAMREVA
jgi:ribonuclease HI